MPFILYITLIAFFFSYKFLWHETRRKKVLILEAYQFIAKKKNDEVVVIVTFSLVYSFVKERERKRDRANKEANREIIKNKSMV